MDNYTRGRITTEGVKAIDGECRNEQMGRSGPARGGDTSPAGSGRNHQLQDSTDGVS